MFIQLVLVVLLFSICSAQHSTDFNTIKEKNHLQFEKAFTAVCESSNTVKCSYSVLFGTLNSEYSTTSNIIVNGYYNNFTVTVTNKDMPVIENFEVSKGDSIDILFDPGNTDAFYQVYNQPDAQGSLIFSSTSRNFLILNTCENSCQFEIQYTSDVWTLGASITLRVNNEVSIVFTGPSQNFNVMKGDTISFHFNAASGTSSLSVKIGQDLTDIIWNQDAFANAISLINPCGLNPSSRSPFGGYLYPITDEEVENFLQDNSSPSMWFPLTYV